MSDNKSNSSPPSPEGRSPRDPDRPELSRGPRVPRGLILIILLAVTVIALFQSIGASEHDTMSFTEFQKHWNDAEKRYEGFDKARLEGEVLRVRRTQPKKEESTPKDGPNLGLPNELWFKVNVPDTALDSQFLRDLGTIPDFRYEPTNQFVGTFLQFLLWLVLPLGLFYFLILRPLRTQGGPGNVLSFGRSRPRLIAKENTTVKFKDVAGIDEAKEEVSEVIEFLKNPEKFQRLGGRIPRGLLFVGPPGTGKTLLAKAIAGEADVPFYSISGSDFVEMFVGVGASRVRDLFRQAKENTPCIIFLDEVDAVGRRRGSGLGGGHDEREQTLNAILVEMDGFETNEQVIVIASTNRPDVLDPALLRPGRFDREIVISLPDVKGRYEILKVHARRIKLGDDVDLMKIARGTPMFSGADLEAIINEAAIRATMAGKSFVEHEDLEEARDKVRFGRERRSQVLDEHEREVTAYHEAGHAMILLKCPDVEPLHKVTIIPRGMSLGSTMWLPLKDRYNMSRRNMLGNIKVAFGGRIAEQLFCDDITSGASQDIEQATNMARKMVCDWGMSDLGPIHYANKEQHVFLGGEVSHPREFSEATAEKIDAEVRKIINECYAEAEAILRDSMEETSLIAKALLKHETLTAEEIDAILKAKDINVVSKNGEDEHSTQPKRPTGAEEIT